MMTSQRNTGALALILMCVSAPAFAQNQCRVPEKLPKIRAEFPPPGNAVRSAATGYQLVMTWSPQFCKENGDEKKHAPRCKEQKFGFTLDSLRAESTAGASPVYCRRMGPVPVAVARKAYCATPSVNLMSHVWAKYGSCIADDAEDYFATGTALFATLKWPDMNALSQTQLDVGKFRDAMTAANPGFTTDMFAVKLTPLGWLDELRLCLDTNRRPRSCDSEAGAGISAAMRIWPSY